MESENFSLLFLEPQYWDKTGACRFIGKPRSHYDCNASYRRQTVRYACCRV